MNYKYKVVSLHFTTDCNLDCPMCYRPKKTTCNKPHKWFKDLIPHIKELAPQVALGGGEPFMYPEFVADFARECKKHDLICNVTTNGTQPMAKFVKDIEMVSVSYDYYKNGNLIDYKKKIQPLKNKTRIGCNYLIEGGDIGFPRIFMMKLQYLFDKGVERVFALYPKNWEFLDILKFKPIYYAPTFKYKHFYVDDLTNQILREGKYSDWKNPCHFGRDIISINERGEVMGCSFSNTPLLSLDKPEDLMEIKNVKIKERYSCPYLKINI